MHVRLRAALDVWGLGAGSVICAGMVQHASTATWLAVQDK
jgi:hypothetical protein